MAERRPIVNISGEDQELPAGDTLPGTASVEIAAVSRAHSSDLVFTTTPTNAGWNVERITLDATYFSTATDNDIEVAKTLAYEIHVTASVSLTTGGDTESYLDIFVNGSAVATLQEQVKMESTGRVATLSVSTVLELTSGQRIGPRFSKESGSGNPTALANSLQWTLTPLETEGATGSSPIQTVDTERFKLPATELQLSDNMEATLAFYHGSTLDTIAATVTESGGTVTINVEKSGGGDLTLIFSSGYFAFDTTPAATLTLTAGTDVAPTRNFVYILESTKALTVSTSSFPATEHVPIADILVQSASGVASDGVYKLDIWIDHTGDDTSNGHLTHINKWIRDAFPLWKSGVSQTLTITPGSPDTVIFTTSSGVVLQLHEKVFPAFSGTPDLFVVNNFIAAFTKISDLAAILDDSQDGSLTDKFYSLVIWGAVSENTGDCKLFVNLPGGSYSNQSDVESDPSKFANYTIPEEFRGAGFLISELKLRNESDSDWTSIAEIDLRGLFPPTAAGTASGITDSSAIHTNVPAEISTITLKTVMVDGDIFVIEDSASGFAKKRIPLSDFLTSIGFDKQRFDSNSFTSLRTGGELTINADPAKFDIANGTAFYVDSTTAATSTVTKTSWTGLTAITVTNLATQPFTVVGIDSTGSVVQQLADFSPAQKRDIVELGVLAHPDMTVIFGIFEAQQIGYDLGSEVNTFFGVFGPINASGNVFSPNATDLQIQRSAGTTWSPGSNYSLDKKSPSIVIDAIFAPATFAINFIDPASPNGFGAITGRTAIDPDEWDDGTGVIATVANNKWTIQRIFHFPRAAEESIHLGQKVYNSKAEAVTGITQDAVSDTPFLAANATLRARLVVQQGTTDLTDLTDAEFFDAGKFGTQIGGAGTFTPNTILGLDDVSDSTYSAKSGQVLAVNAGETGMALITNPTAHNTSTAAHLNLSKIDGTIAYTGEVAGVTPTVTASLATKGYTDGEITSHAGNANVHHAQVHTIVSHDTSATGNDLDELTDGSTTTLHEHAPAPVLVNIQTGTTYTLVDTDLGKVVTCNNASDITVSINTGLTAGFHCLVRQLGAGQVIIAGTATVNNASDHDRTRDQYSAIGLIYQGVTNIYNLDGDSAEA